MDDVIVIVDDTYFGVQAEDSGTESAEEAFRNGQPVEVQAIGVSAEVRCNASSYGSVGKDLDMSLVPFR